MRERLPTISPAAYARVTLATLARASGVGPSAVSWPARGARVAAGWRAPRGPGGRRGPPARFAPWSVRGLWPPGAITISPGTAAPAAGPRAGGTPHERIHRLH